MSDMSLDDLIAFVSEESTKAWNAGYDAGESKRDTREYSTAWNAQDKAEYAAQERGRAFDEVIEQLTRLKDLEK